MIVDAGIPSRTSTSAGTMVMCRSCDAVYVETVRDLAGLIQRVPIQSKLNLRSCGVLNGNRYAHSFPAVTHVYMV
jgi:hypothetical protein